MLTYVEVKELLIYDPESGIFFWKNRPWQIFRGKNDNDSKAKAKTWNTRNAGKKAGSYDRLGYLKIRLIDRYYYGHRLAWLLMTGEWPENLIDHKDRANSNNRWENLREATYSQNMANSLTSITSKTGVKGVSWSSALQKYKVTIMVDGTSIFLGYYEELQEAAEIYKNKALELFGDFAHTGE